MYALNIEFRKGEAMKRLIINLFCILAFVITPNFDLKVENFTSKFNASSSLLGDDDDLPDQH